MGCEFRYCAGAKTGRSPRDKRVVREPASEKDIWWAAPDGQASNGAPNYEMDERYASGCLLHVRHTAWLHALQPVLACNAVMLQCKLGILAAAVSWVPALNMLAASSLQISSRPRSDARG